MNIALVDISHIFRSKMHASGDLPVAYAADEVVKYLHTIDVSERGYNQIGCCFDRKPYIRNTMFPEYKANREREDIAVQEQYLRLRRKCHDMGFIVLEQEGFEADDIIASAVHQLAGSCKIDIHTNDKDLMQLVTPDVKVVSTASGVEYDPAAVVAKFGVVPEKIPHMLALVGDVSDNVPGVPGIGPKSAALLINAYGSVEETILAAEQGQVAMVKGLLRREKAQEAILEHRLSAQQALLLIELMNNAAIPAAELLKPRAKKAEPMSTDTSDYDHERYEDEERAAIQEEPVRFQKLSIHGRDERPSGHPDGKGDLPEPRTDQPKLQSKSQAIEVASPAPSTALAVPPTLDDAIELRPGVYLTERKARMMVNLAAKMHASGLYTDKFHNESTIMTTMLAGMELGLGPTASLNQFHRIEGKLSPSSHFIISLAQNAPNCVYLECVEEKDGSVTYACKKKNMPTELRFTYTLEDARQDKMKWAADGMKNQRAMLRKTAGCQAARLWFPAATCGLYAPAEMGYVEEEEQSA